MHCFVEANTGLSSDRLVLQSLFSTLSLSFCRIIWIQKKVERSFRSFFFFFSDEKTLKLMRNLHKYPLTDWSMSVWRSVGSTVNWKPLLCSFDAINTVWRCVFVGILRPQSFEKLSTPILEKKKKKISAVVNEFDFFFFRDQTRKKVEKERSEEEK